MSFKEKSFNADKHDEKKEIKPREVLWTEEQDSLKTNEE